MADVTSFVETLSGQVIQPELSSNQNKTEELDKQSTCIVEEDKKRANTGIRAKDGKWLPGYCPNPTGRPKTKPLTDAFKQVLANPKTTMSVARNVIQKCKRDPRMLEQVLDRVEGKVIQQIDLNATIGIAERISRARTMQADEVIEVEAQNE